MVVTSEVLGTRERLSQGRYSAMRRPGVAPATCWLQVQRPNHCTTEPRAPYHADKNHPRLFCTCWPSEFRRITTIFRIRGMWQNGSDSKVTGLSRVSDSGVSTKESELYGRLWTRHPRKTYVHFSLSASMLSGESQKGYWACKKISKSLLEDLYGDRAYPRIIYENKTRSPCMSGRFMLQVWNYKKKHYVIEKQPYTQLHLGLDHTKFTQDRPPVQSDTVPSCNMAFLTTRTGLPTVNIHPSHFTHAGDFNY